MAPFGSRGGSWGSVVSLVSFLPFSHHGISALFFFSCAAIRTTSSISGTTRAVSVLPEIPFLPFWYHSGGVFFRSPQSNASRPLLLPLLFVGWRGHRCALGGTTKGPPFRENQRGSLFV